MTKNVSVVEKLGPDFPFLELLKKHGLKEYMRKFRDQTNDKSIKQAYDALNEHFHHLFTRITQFEYLKNGKNYWQHKLWNVEGIIPFIFQYLDLYKLIQCSFVHSIWLYHSFNPNSIYYFRATAYNLTRLNKIWIHRLSRIQALKIEYPKYDFDHSDCVGPKREFQEKLEKGLKKLMSASKRVKRVEIFAGCRVCLFLIFESLHNNKIDVNLQQFTCCLGEKGQVTKCTQSQSQIQLQLTNCHTIKLENIVVHTFSIVLSDKCKYMCISGKVDNQHNFLSDNGDCSGIQTLEIDHIHFISDDGKNNINNNNNNNNNSDINSENKDNNADDSSKKINIFANSMRTNFNRIQNLLVGYLTTDTWLLWQHLSANNINCNINPVVTLILRLRGDRGYSNEKSNTFDFEHIQSTDYDQVIPAQHWIINVPDTGEMKFLNTVLVQKSILQQCVKTIELNLHSTDICQAFFSDKIDCKNGSFANTIFIQPNDTFSKINTSEQLKQNGIECGVSGKCLIGWKRSDIGNEFTKHPSIDANACIASVYALRFNEKTKKLFVQYARMRCLFNTKESGEWHQLPNDNFYPCPKNNSYNIKSKNLIYRIHENFQTLNKVNIIIDKIKHDECKNWVIDLLKSFTQLKCLALNLTIHVLELNNDNDQELNLIKKIFQHIKKLIDENVVFDIKIQYSTFSFAQCDKLFLKILKNDHDRKKRNRKCVTLDHVNCSKTGMVLFRARLK